MLNFINGENGVWWSFESCENVGTTIIMYLKV